LEAASALRKYGLQVHVVTRHEVPLARQLGERIGRSIRELHERRVNTPGSSAPGMSGRSAFPPVASRQAS
ncbi:FAD-dependent oxidoreductase, partial [Pseudomonas kurunegalensis]|nr:FAD-dependent oxidoreductase [Pseudomonas kurunegalensis]